MTAGRDRHFGAVAMGDRLLREFEMLFRVEASHNPDARPCARLWHHEVDPSEEERAWLLEQSKRIGECVSRNELGDRTT